MIAKASISLLVFLFLCRLLPAQQAVVLHDSLPQQAVGERLMYLPDPQGRYSLEQVLSGEFARQFRLAEEGKSNFGFVNHPYWFRVRVDHQSPVENRFYFDVAYPPLDSITFYYQDIAGNWRSELAGDMLPFDNRNGYYFNYLFRIRQDTARFSTYYFRVSTQGQLTFPVYVRQNEALRETIAISYLIYGLYYGAIVLILLYNLFLFFSLRIGSYLYYCLFIFFNMLAQMYLYGHAQQFLWPWGGHINNLMTSMSLLVSVGFALLFSMFFLNTRSTTPRIHKVLQVLSIVAFGLAALVPFVPYYTIISLVPKIYIINVVAIVFAAGTAWYKGHRSAIIFLLAWIIYLIGLFSYSLQSMGVIGDLETATFLVMTGTVLDVLLLSLALADRIRQYRLERQMAQEEALLALTEKKELLEQQHQILEQRVSERTLKLQQKQKEVIQKNRRLNEQQLLIEEQYQQLSILNENQEKIIHARTGELRKANLDLRKRNQQLEQFAYIISHNLRGPVASMLGLLRLFDRKPIEGTENLQYLDMLQQSVNKLDTIIMDLGQVLAIEQNLVKHFREISYGAVVQGILEKLQLQVQEIKPILETRFDEESISSHPSYLESILYNLISNALKYRSPDRPLHISIKSWRQGDEHLLSISDNGLGIDLEAYEKRLFTLYQRFHPHIEGKGLGLYMVKRQISALGGKIDVTSKLGEGTTFTISLPVQHQ
jgi:two-component system, sensor histidine kinase LadS